MIWLLFFKNIMINLICKILHKLQKFIVWRDYIKICSIQIGFGCVRNGLSYYVFRSVLVILIRNRYMRASINPSFTSVLSIHDNPVIMQNKNLNSCCENMYCLWCYVSWSRSTQRKKKPINFTQNPLQPTSLK